MKNNDVAEFWEVIKNESLISIVNKQGFVIETIENNNKFFEGLNNNKNKKHFILKDNLFLIEEVLKEEVKWQGYLNTKIKNITYSLFTFIYPIKKEKTTNFLIVNYKSNNINNKDKFHEYYYFKTKAKEILKNHYETEETEEKVFLLSIKIRNIKDVGEKLGYEKEQLLLNLIEKKVNKIDCSLLTKVDSDKFLLLFEKMTTTNAQKTCEQIINDFKERIKISDHKIFITLNIGCVFCSDENEQVIFEKAEIALNEAISIGKNQYIFYQKQLEKTDILSYKKFILENDLFDSIEKNKMNVLFQPQVRTSDGKILSTNLKIYWKHSEWGKINNEEIL